jgi:hypothetical protein
VTEQVEADPAAVSAIESLMQVFLKGLRASQLYLPNNPVYQKAIENLRAAFEPVWEHTSEVDLRVTESALLWDDAPVLKQEERNESVAWLLFKDGVRTISLSPGVEDEEILRLLQTLNKARGLPADAADDLLTLLWEQDFQYIRYDYLELGDEGAPPLEKTEGQPPPPAGAAKQAIEEEVEEERDPTGIVSMDDFDSTLYFLSEQEVKYLTEEIEREYQQDMRGNVLAMLFDLLELQTYPTVRAELISILENFLPYLLAVGDFRAVALILRELRVVLKRAREVLPEHRDTLQAFPDVLSSPETLGQLLQSLDEAHVHPSEDDLGELFRELRPRALTTILEWLPRLSNDRVRALLDASARRLCQAYPDQMVTALKGDDDEVLLGTIRLAGQLKLPPVVPALGSLLERGSLEVRREAVEALAAIATAGALKQLELGINDEDRDTRVNAVRHLAKAEYRGAFQRIEAVLASGELKDADLTERTVFFEAFGELAGDGGIATLEPMLASKGFMKKKVDPQIRACAAMALGKIGSEPARAVLEAAAKDKDPLVRNAVNKALRESR